MAEIRHTDCSDTDGTMEGPRTAPVTRKQISGSVRRQWVPAIVRRLVDRARRPPVADPDSQVLMWKESWVAGAEARWAGTPRVNPYHPRSPRSGAWAAGWRWAEQQPDRRSRRRVQLAHPRRRRTDASLRRVRSVQASAIGISTLVLAGWLWRTRRPRQSDGGSPKSVER
jgi:hypothetical protein